MINSNQDFSVWLVPENRDYCEMVAIINTLSLQHNSTAFEPHVTIYTGSCHDRDFAKSVISDIFRGISPLSLAITNLQVSESFFKTLFIELSGGSVLGEITEKIKRRLKQDSRYTLQPHLSLMYGEMSLKKKLEIARNIDIKKAELLFDKVKLISPGRPFFRWQDVSKWETWSSYDLGY